MSQQTWRNIFIGIIVLTIPCYLLGIGTYYLRGGGDAAATSTPAARPTITPFDPNLLVSQTVSVLQTQGTEIFGTQPTALDIEETPVSIVTNTPVFAFNTSTPIQVLPPTATATVFTVPTNTPTVFVPPTSTATASPTQPILVPPTDTPAP